MAWMTFNRSSSRIVLVIIPVAFIPGAPRKGSIQHALAPETRHFYLAETRHFNFVPTYTYQSARNLYVKSTFDRLAGLETLFPAPPLEIEPRTATAISIDWSSDLNQNKAGASECGFANSSLLLPRGERMSKPRFQRHSGSAPHWSVFCTIM